MAGPDGALWFTEPNENNIGRITTAGTITTFNVPTQDSTPFGITTGPDGAIWFTEEFGLKIGRITTAGRIAEFPFTGGYPMGIATGPDGALRFPEYSQAIGRMTTAGAYSSYLVPTVGATPQGIVAGPDGAMWFTEVFGNNIGRITTAGVVTEYPVQTANSQPNWIAQGPDSAIWFSEFVGNHIGRITTAGVVTEYPVPFAQEQQTFPWMISEGPNGALWFTEYLKVGEAFFVTANLSVTPGSGPDGTALGFTGNGFSPNEDVRIYKSGVGSAVLASAAAGADGGFTVAGSAPDSVYGPRIFVATGATSGKLGAASFSSAPSLAISPHAGPAGSTAVASGFGFAPLEQVKVYWNSPLMYLGAVNADVRGSFSGTAGLLFTVPPDAPSGVQIVGAKGQTSLAPVTGPSTLSK